MDFAQATLSGRVSSHDAPGPRGPGSKARSSQKPDISSPAKC